MRSFSIEPVESFDVTIKSIAPDKSISHRAALFSLLSDKASCVRNFLEGEDTLCMLRIVEQLGAKVVHDGEAIFITPPKNLQEPDDILDCGNAGTAMRLLIGFLSTKKGFFVLHGDKYLAYRPMRRIIEPLQKIGADIGGRAGGEFSPLYIKGKKLESFNFKSPIASAQLKSAMILAALTLDAKSTYEESETTRDHTERMLLGMGAKIEKEKNKLTIYPQEKPLRPLDITIPADPSSGFFFAVAAAITPHSKVTLKNILLNETRIEAYKILQKMGVSVDFIKTSSTYEDIGDIVVCHRELKSIHVEKNISWLIDEIPALAIAFACADGISEVRNAKELRVKESDRIKTTIINLQECGIKVEEFEDGFRVFGGSFQKSHVKSFGDHRIAMSFLVAGLRCGIKVDDIECIETSFPNFLEILKGLNK